MGSETNINTFIKWTNFEIELNEKFYNARDFVHNALCGKKIIYKLYIYIKFIEYIGHDNNNNFNNHNNGIIH